MGKTFELILELVKRKEVLLSNHGYDELAEDSILMKDVMHGVEKGIIVEDYPNYFKGPCVLVFQKDLQKKPIHIVWGVSKGTSSPAVVVTGYRPDPKQWSEDFLRRKLP